jgi:hypothetical protein
MTASELRNLLIRDIVRSTGGGTMRWRKAIGTVRVYSRATHAHCNWEVWPSGGMNDVAIVERAVDRIRPLHPYVDEG